MKRLLFVSLLFTLTCPAMELPDANQQKAYQDLEQARSEYCQALTSKQNVDAAKQNFLDKQKNYTAITDQHDQKQANALAQQTSDKYAADEFKNTMKNPVSTHLELAEKKEKTTYNITDNTGIYELTPEQHLILMQCETYKNNVQETDIVDVSSSIVPSAIKENILTLINIIQNPARIDEINDKKIVDLFELANYLDAPKEEITKRLADQCYLFLERKKEELSGREKALSKEAEKNLYYETFEEFCKDYKQKEETDLPLDLNTNDFSYARLKSLGFIKKIKSLQGLSPFLWQSARWAINDTRYYPKILLSGHAITDFALKDFYFPGLQRIFTTIDLSNNKITTLNSEQLTTTREIDDHTTLLLDNNPIAAIRDCANYTKIPKPIIISLKNILLTKEMLEQLPPLETILDKSARKLDYITANYEKSTVTSVLLSSISAAGFTILFDNYLISKGFLKKNLISDIVKILHPSINATAVLFVQAMSIAMLTKKINQIYPLPNLQPIMVSIYSRNKISG